MRSFTLVAALLLATPGMAQDAEPGEQSKAEKPVLGSDDLANEQAHVAVTLEKIEETMKRIAKILEKRNPDPPAMRVAATRTTIG